MNVLSNKSFILHNIQISNIRLTLIIFKFWLIISQYELIFIINF